MVVGPIVLPASWPVHDQDGNGTTDHGASWFLHLLRYRSDFCCIEHAQSLCAFSRIPCYPLIQIVLLRGCDFLLWSGIQIVMDCQFILGEDLQVWLTAVDVHHFDLFDPSIPSEEGSPGYPVRRPSYALQWWFTRTMSGRTQFLSSDDLISGHTEPLIKHWYPLQDGEFLESNIVREDVFAFRRSPIFTDVRIPILISRPAH